MTKVYLVWWDNGEPWEDGYSYVSGVFSTMDKVREYITFNRGYSFQRGYNDFVQPARDCPAGLKQIEEDSSVCEECKQYCVLLDNEYDNSFMYIEEKTVDKMDES